MVETGITGIGGWGMDYQSMGENFLQGFGILAIVVAITEMLWRNTAKGRLQNACIAVVFSLGIMGTMLLPFSLQEGFVFDLRHVFLVIAGAFAGLAGIIGTVLTAIVLRVIEGGAGQVAGLVGICVASAVGLVYWQILKSHALNLRMLVSMGLTSNLFFAGLLVLPSEVALMVVKLVGPILAGINFIGIFVAGHQLARVRRNLDREGALEEENKKDPLTGLLNRRAFKANGRNSANQALAVGQSYAMFVFDIDNFKAINDTFGHASGDKVIMKVAQVLSAKTPLNGELGRFGGEEYILMVPNINEAGALKLAERMRAAVEEEAHLLKEMSIRVTISCGFYVVTGNDVSWETAFEVADKALYRAKEAGRNRVISATQSMDEISFEEQFKRPDPELLATPLEELKKAG